MSKYSGMSADEIYRSVLGKGSTGQGESRSQGTSQNEKDGTSGGTSGGKYSGMSADDIFNSVMGKLETDSYKKYQSWVSTADAYTRTLSNITTRRNGAWTKDTFGGTQKGLEQLLGKYDEVAADLDDYDKGQLRKRYNQLKGMYDSYASGNEFYSQFHDQDDYDRQRSGYGNFGVGYSAGSWGLSDSEARGIRKQQSQKDAQESQRALAEYTAAKKDFQSVDQEYRIHSKGDSDGGAFSDEYEQDLTNRWSAAKAKVDAAESKLLGARNRLDAYNATWGKIDQYAGDTEAAKGTDTSYQGVSYDELVDWENKRQTERLIQEAQATRTDYVPEALKYTADTEPQAEDRLGLWRSMSQQQRQDAANGQNSQLAKLAFQGSASYWDLLTDDEVSTYYYIRSQRGQEAANQYLADMDIELSRRNDAAIVGDIQGASKLEKAGMTALSVGANLVGTIPAAMGAAADTIAGRKNPYSSSGVFKRYVSYVRGTVGQDIGDWTEDKLADKYGEKFAAKAGEIANQTFQALMSGVDSLAGDMIFGRGVGIPVGPFNIHVGGYTTVMGLGAFADRAQEMQLKGATNAQIALGAIGSGVLEALFEDVSMEVFFTNILDNPATTLKEFTKKLAIQMGVEASEEVFTEIGNILWDGIVMGKSCDTEVATREYMAQGMSEQEARRRATLDNIQDIVWAGYGGAISAGAMSAFGQAISSGVNNYAVGSKLLKNGRAVDLQEQAASLTNERKRAKLQKAAAEVSHNASVGDKSVRNTYRIGKVATQIAQQAGREARSAEMAEFRAAAEKYLAGQRDIQNKERALNVLTRAYEGTTTLPGDKTYMRLIGGEKLTQEILDSVGGKETLQENAKPRVEASMRTISGVQSSVLGIAPEINAEFDSDNSGQAFRKSDSEPVNIRADEPIARVENGILYLNTDDGQEIAAGDVSYGNSGEAAVYAAISSMQTDTETARSLLAGIEDSGMSSAAYARALRNAFYRGMNGAKLGDTPDYSGAAKLPEAQRMAAWEAGRRRRSAATQRRAALVDSGKAGTRENGLVIQESARNIRNQNKQQQAGMAAAKALAAAGLHVEVYASTEAERQAGKPNGIYRKADGSIAIDLNAGNNGQGAVAYALAHETTHFIKDYSPAKYEAYADLIIAAAEDKGISYDGLLARQLARLSEMEEYKGLSEQDLQDIAYDETIAEMSETILTDTDAAQRLSQQIYKQDKGLWEKIKDFFTGLVEKLRNAYRDSDPDSEIGRLLKRAVQDNTEIAQAWADAVSDAGENYQLQDGQKKNAREGVRFSLRGKTQQELTANFQAEVDSVLNMQDTTPKQLVVGYTPSLYESLGMPSLPLTIGSGHVYSAAKTEAQAKQDGNFHKGTHYHGLGDTAVKNICSAIQDPVMVIAAKDVNKNVSPLRSTHSVVAIVDIGTAQKSLLVPIEITAERKVNGTQMDVNTISSIYEKSVGNLVNEAIALENSGDIGIFYAKKEATTLPVAGVQFPVQLQQPIASDGIVHRLAEKVNMKVSEATQSRQFKRWFGDWQNDPANASKVVNTDGTPKRLYRYTNLEDTVIKPDYRGAIWMADNDWVTSQYGNRNDVLYANIRNPYVHNVTGTDFSEETALVSARKGGHDGLVINFMFTGENNSYYKFMLENVPDTNAQGVLSSIVGNSEGLAKQNETISEFDRRMKENGNIGYSYYAVFDQKNVKSATDNIGTFDKSNPDIRYSSRTDSTGRALSEAQAKYFENSEVRDEDGNLLPVYHRTDSEFYRFDRTRLGGNALGNATDAAMAATALIGHWFSDHDVGENLGGRAIQSYVNIENPYSTSLTALAEKIQEQSEDSAQMQEDYDYGDYAMTRQAADAFVEWLRGNGYDGLVVTDEEFGGNSYVVLDSEQAKLTTNETPTGSPDIRFSDRNSQSKQVERLERKNAELKAQAEYLRQVVKIQKSGNKAHILDRSSVNAIGKGLMESVNAKGSEFGKKLNDFYRALGTEDMSYEAMQDRAGELAEWLLEHHQAERDSYAQEVLDFLKKRRVSLSDSQIGDIEYSYGSLNDFKRAIKGSIILDQNAQTSLDQLWQEAAAQFPDRFGADVTESNMPDGLAQVVNWANSAESSSEAEFQYYRAEQKADLTERILMGYLEAKPVESVSENMKRQLEDLKQQHKEEIKQLRQEWDEEAKAMEKSHAYDLKAEKQRSAAALDAMKAAQRAIDIAQKGLWETERQGIKLSYERQMEQLRKTYSKDTAAYQQEFINALENGEYKDAKSQTLRRMLNELAHENAKGDKDAEASRKQVYEGLRQQYELEKDIGKLKNKVQQQREAAAQKVESRKKTEERHKLQNTIDTLNKYLLQPTNTAHVPQGLQSSVAMALRAINGVIGDSKAAQNADRLSQYAEQLRELEKNPSANGDKIADLNRKIQNLTGRDSSMKAALGALQEQYHKLETQGNSLYDSNIEAMIQDTMEQIGDTEYRNLSLQQLKAVRDSYTALLTTIRNANKAFVAGQNQRIDEMVKRATIELSLMKKKNPNQTAMGRNIEQFFWNNEKPVYAFERIGSAVMSELYGNLRKGEDTFYRDVSEARDFFLESAEKNGFDKWNLNELKEFTAADGRKFQLSLDEIMSLYTYSLRPQAREHLTRGGIVLGENTKRFTKGPLGVTRETTYSDAYAYTLTDEAIDAIADSLTKEQRQFAFEMQQYLAKIMGAKGDEVNMALYGIKKFGEETYWPLKSSNVFSERVRAQQENPGNKLKNKGFTKALTQHANNAIELSTLTETWAEHVSDMSMYHAFTLPMEDFYRVYNWNQRGDVDGKQTMGVRQMIQQTAGKGAVNYIDQFLKDLNGGLRADPRETVSKAMLSGFKKAAVSASLSVAIQQPSAVGRALAYIEPKYFLGGKVEGVKFAETWEQLKKYAAVAGLKEMGRFDVDMGRSTLEYIIGRNGLSTWGKVMDKVDTASGWLPEMADQVTWCAIWEAAKRKTQAQNPGLRGEALLQKAGELFTDTITRTQVYDSVFSRSANMRAKSGLMSMATAFMAEPTTTANMVEDAVRKFQKGDKRMASKMLSSVAFATVLNAALAAVVYAARDDDKDKTYWEKYLASLAGETADSFNPLTYVPIVADINNLLLGYSIERTDMSLASDLVTALKKIATLYQQYDDDWDEDKKAEWKKKVEKAWADNVLMAGTVMGLPLKNIYRDVKAAVNVATNPSNGAEMSADTILPAMLNSARKNLPVVSWIADESNSDQLYKAITQGKTVLAKRLKAQYKSEAAYESAVLKGLRENDPRITQAAQYLLDKNTPKRVALIRQIVAEGHYTQDQVIKAVNQKANSMTEKTASSKKSTPEKLYDYDEYVNAAANELGYAADVQAEIISYQADRNQEKDAKITRQQAEEAAEKTFQSSVKRETKDSFAVGELTEGQARKALTATGYWDESEIDDILLQWKTELTLGGEIDWGDSKYLEYAQEIEPAGISAEIYDEWLWAVKYDLIGEDANGDGKIDRYSAIKQKAEYINALPLTAAQKDILFATVSDSEKTRRKYRLW